MEELENRLLILEGRLSQAVAEVQTYKFLITRLLVEQRDLVGRINELERICSALSTDRMRGDSNA